MSILYNHRSTRQRLCPSPDALHTLGRCVNPGAELAARVTAETDPAGTDRSW